MRINAVSMPYHQKPNHASSGRCAASGNNPARARKGPSLEAPSPAVAGATNGPFASPALRIPSLSAHRSNPPHTPRVRAAWPGRPRHGLPRNPARAVEAAASTVPARTAARRPRRTRPYSSSVRPSQPGSRGARPPLSCRSITECHCYDTRGRCRYNPSDRSGVFWAETGRRSMTADACTGSQCAEATRPLAATAKRLGPFRVTDSDGLGPAAARANHLS